MGIENDVFEDDNPPQCDAAYLNSVRAEINNIITNTGQSSTTGNLNQLGIAAAIMAAGSDYYTDTGSANAYSLVPVGSKSAPISYFSGMRVRFIVAHTNTNTSTINVNAIGVKNIKGRDGSSAISPGDFVAGQLVELFYDGTNFVVSNGVPFNVATIPSGAIYDWPGTIAPAGYLFCFGQAISRVTYSTLFGLLSTTWGTGDGVSTFNLPDFRGRTRIGLDNMGGTAANRITNIKAASLNPTGGGAENTSAAGSVSGNAGTSGGTSLSAAQMATLSYFTNLTSASPGATVNIGGGQSGGGLVGTDTTSISTNAGNQAHTHAGGAISAAFTGSPVDTTQPWLALNVIIKI